MREPLLVPQPVHTPGVCFLCRSPEGPLVDTTLVLQPGNRRLYFCVRTCVALFARLAGWTSPEDTDLMLCRIADAGERIGELEQQLADANASRVVPLADVFASIRQGTSTANSAA